MQNYPNFVDYVLSEQSKDSQAFLESFEETNHNVNLPRLMTGAIGLSSESGEYLDVVKKILFQGKQLDDVTKNKLINELGDVLFYLTVSLIALNITLEEVLESNISKLSERYPEGFDVKISESRYK